MTYKELKNKHEQEVNALPLVFAFSDSQFVEGMKKLGLEEHETDKVYSIGYGGFIRKTDSPLIIETFDRHEKEMQDAIDSDLTGDGFIFDMFDYELSNHEYCITGNGKDALNALAISTADLKEDPKLMHGYKKACANQVEWYRQNG